jgi:outer membrane protein assembly factor BamB
MKSPICVTNRKQTASFRMVGSMLTIASLWLMLATANTSAYAQTTSSPADWTQFHRDNMQRWNPYETILGVGNVGSLQLKWKTPLVVMTGLSSPAVVNGVVYIGSDDGKVYAFSASTGAELWSYTTRGDIVSSPAVANGVVYVGSYDGNLYALDATTGAKKWNYYTGSAVASSPTVANGIVYVGNNAGNVYALNASTGSQLWTFAGGDGTFSSPALANGVVYVGSQSVYALNASTGVQLWRYSTDLAPSALAVANGVIYAASTSNVYALNANTGVNLWTYSINPPFNVRSSPAVANGVVYFGCDDGNVYALNAGTGVKLWSFSGGFELSSPAVANGVVYIDGGETAYALNAITGALLWSYPVGGGVNSSPVVVNGVLYVQAGDVVGQSTGNVYAFAAPNTNSADLFLRVQPSTTTVHQGDLLTYAFPVWNLGPANADYEVLTTQVPEGTTLDYVRISGTPGLGTCTTPPYGGTGEIVCHENSAMAPNTTWTVRVVVKVTAPAGTVITESAATMADTPDPNLANNTATVSITVQ